MKNTIRARKNGSASRVASQHKNLPPETKRNPAPAVKNHCLSLLEWQDGAASNPICMGEIQIPTDIFKVMQKKADAADDGDFFALLTVGLEAMTKPVDSCALKMPSPLIMR